MSKLLIDEPPLQVLPSLAEEVGLNEAIVLQQIHYWLGRSTNVEEDENEVERRWVYKSLDDWAEEISFWSKSTIKRTLRSLKNQGVIIAEQKRKDEGDPTVWYSIKYDELPPYGQNDHRVVVNMTTSGGQDDHHRARSTTRARPETTTENNNNTRARESEAVKAYREIFPRQPNQIQAEQITHKVDDLDLWKEVLTWWAENGHRAKSVGKMLNKYRQTDNSSDLYRDRPSENGAASPPEKSREII